MRVSLICLARRGGMVHFHGELVSALAELIPTVAITAKTAVSFHDSTKAIRLNVNTGAGAFGTFFYAINPLTWFRIFQALKESNADVFHLVAPHEWNLILGFLIKLLRKPLIYTVHDPEHHLGAPLYIRILENIFRRMPDGFIVLSKLARQELQSMGFPADRVFYVPIAAYSHFSKMHRPEARPEKAILFFGRIEPYKGLDLLLKAMSEVFVEFPDWKLILAGAGDLSRYRSYLNSSQIEVINRYISDEDVAGLMLRSRFVVLPYTEATQSGVVPIAYAFGRPVIATNVGSLSEMVLDGKTGLIVSPADPVALASAIKRLTLDQELCEEMGRTAYKMSREDWSPGGNARAHLEVYSIVGRRYERLN